MIAVHNLGNTVSEAKVLRKCYESCALGGRNSMRVMVGPTELESVTSTVSR